jgi:hypothetical protein
LHHRRQRGIEQPLEGVGTPQGRILLNGFKRYRCAEKLNIASVPYISLGDDEALAIASLMQRSKDTDLNILEQAKFVVELLTVQQMRIADVAELLCRSKAWVCVRKSLLEEMNEEIQQVLLRGKFPVYSYMHTLRPLMRLNGIGQDKILRFIKAVAGQSLSVREIQLLAEYPLPADGVQQQRFSPPGQPRPKCQPRPRKRDSRYEEQRLRALGEEVESYLNYALAASGIQRHRFLRALFAFSRQVTSEVFVKMAQRALRYRILDLEALRRIAWYCMSQEGLPLPEAEVDENLQQRPAYQEGYLTEEPDLSIYDDMFPQTDDQDPSDESEDQDG